MRIAIDTNALYTTKAGTARYIRGLLQGIEQVGASDMDYFELAWEVENFGYRQPARGLKTLYRELVWMKHVAPNVLKKEGADLLHITAFCPIPCPDSIPKVVTLLDLAVFRNPMRYRPWFRKRGQVFLRQLPEADRIISISRFTADEAADLLGLDAKRIDVVYPACDFTPIMMEETARPPAEPVPDEFFLFVGSLEPGKNLALLRESYDQAEQQGRTLPPLVIVGARWEGVASEGPPPKNWVYLGRQPDEVLLYLYGKTLGLVFPTKYEGFGIPVLEAMTLSCPVLCSPLASLPEVGGQAPLYCEQTAASYREGMTTIAASAAIRNEHIQAGLEQAKKFSWKTCAEGTMEVYRQACRA